MMSSNLINLDQYIGFGHRFQEVMLRRLAEQKFDSFKARGQFSRAWKMMTRRNRKLADLGSAANDFNKIKHARQGITTIPIDKIRGSVLDSQDFDIDFFPIHCSVKQRWLSIAIGMLQGKVPPPVELIQLNDLYFVCDGRYRISVARALKQRYIDAYVTVMTVADPSHARSI